MCDNIFSLLHTQNHFYASSVRYSNVFCIEETMPLINEIEEISNHPIIGELQKRNPIGNEKEVGYKEQKGVDSFTKRQQC